MPSQPRSRSPRHQRCPHDTHTKTEGTCQRGCQQHTLCIRQQGDHNQRLQADRHSPLAGQRTPPDVCLPLRRRRANDWGCPQESSHTLMSAETSAANASPVQPWPEPGLDRAAAPALAGEAQAPLLPDWLPAPPAPKPRSPHQAGCRSASRQRSNDATDTGPGHCGDHHSNCGSRARYAPLPPLCALPV